jgi:hypothetical protein
MAGQGGDQVNGPFSLIGVDQLGDDDAEAVLEPLGEPAAVADLAGSYGEA